MKRKYFLATLFVVALACNLEAYTFNYSGTFTNYSFGNGTIILDMDILSNDSIYGYVNFTGLPSGATLCAAGNFSGIKLSNDSLVFNFTSHDNDAGCGFDWGAFIIMRALLINGCDSITGHYFYQGQDVGYYNLYKTNSAPCNPTGIQQIHNSINIFSIKENPCISCQIIGNINPSDLIIRDILGRKVHFTPTKTFNGFYVNISSMLYGLLFITNLKTGETIKFIRIQ